LALSIKKPDRAIKNFTEAIIAMLSYSHENIKKVVFFPKPLASVLIPEKA